MLRLEEIAGVFSPAFYILYLTGGLSDMIDGTVARRTKTVSEFGERIDTAAIVNGAEGRP